MFRQYTDHKTPKWKRYENCKNDRIFHFVSFGFGKSLCSLGAGKNLGSFGAGNNFCGLRPVKSFFFILMNYFILLIFSSR